METRDSRFLSHDRRRVIWSALLLLVLVGGLFTYKSGSALARVREVRDTGALRVDTALLMTEHPSPAPGVLSRSANYLIVVGPALVFGILIAGAVRTFVSPLWLAKAFDRAPVREQVAAGVAGAPLMLCSCCVAPVFSTIYERSRRLGPSLAVALAAPSLNPAALVLTFMLFQTDIAATRLVMALIAVFLVVPMIVRLAPVRSSDAEIALPRSATAAHRGLAGFLLSSAHVAIRTVPVIVVGVVVSMWLAERLPIGAFTSHTVVAATVAFASLLAVPLALPTFFEIPLALTLLGAGAPSGVAAAVLFAGPAVNLPSLMTIARSTGWKLAAFLAIAVGLVACLGGLLVGLR